MNEIFIKNLRQSIADTVTGRANTRAAGAGLWAWYVRATMSENAPTDENQFVARHESVKKELEEVAPMSKEERNSINSAKSVIKSAVIRGLDVWKRDATGTQELDEEGYAIPRGKSDLQNDKSDFDRIISMLSNVEKITQDEKFEPLSSEQKDEVAMHIKSILAAIGVV